MMTPAEPPPASPRPNFSRRREHLFAFVLCAIVILLIIVTTDSAPTWIYQGF